MKQQLEEIKARSLAALEEANSPAALEDLRVRLLGKKGELTAVLKQMGKLSAEERPVMGQLANSVRATIEAKMEERKTALHAVALEAKLAAEAVDVTIPGKKGSMSVGGTMKMKTHERVQISLLMPILRTEVARIEVTPDEVLLVDRMNKRFVRATKAELKNVLSKNVEFSRLEKILMDASLPGGKTELTGKDIGIPSLEKAKVQLYEFSTQEFSITPTELTSKYNQIPLEELVKMLVALL